MQTRLSEPELFKLDTGLESSVVPHAEFTVKVTGFGTCFRVI